MWGPKSAGADLGTTLGWVICPRSPEVRLRGQEVRFWGLFVSGVYNWESPTKSWDAGSIPAAGPLRLHPPRTPAEGVRSFEPARKGSRWT